VRKTKLLVTFSEEKLENPDYLPKKNLICLSIADFSYTNKVRRGGLNN